MELKNAFAILKQHQKWRRGDSDNATAPSVLSEAIDVILISKDQLTQTQTKLDEIVAKLEEYDFELAEVEDYVHGDAGMAVTRMRKVINQILKQHSSEEGVKKLGVEGLRKPCCEVLVKLSECGVIHWYSIVGEDQPDTLLMPVFQGGYRVNYCPSCGAYVRNIELNKKQLTRPNQG